jgi:hypothetical protein
MAKRRPRPARKVARFYASVLDEAELVQALEPEGVDEEIAVLRVKLRAHLHDHPEDFRLMLRSIELIARAVAARYRMTPVRKDDLAASLAAALNEVGKQIFPERFADV